ncbi:MAG: carboxylating nicotinate-nucleotide diphosphorylase [Phycisphaerales bacterium]
MPASSPHDLNTLSLPALFNHFASTGLIQRIIELAADEDLGPAQDDDARTESRFKWQAGSGDITTDASIDPSARATAHLIARKPGIIAGLATIPLLLETFTTDVKVETLSQDGTIVEKSTLLAKLEGPLDELLSLERTMLNLIGRLSGVATNTRRHVDTLANIKTKSRLYDTRKTTPGLRVLEKYAVRCGGGFSHRIGLYDAVLLKDNHLAGIPITDLANWVSASAKRARAHSTKPEDVKFIECEVDSLDQLQALFKVPKGDLDIVLLDNMNTSQLAQAVALRDKHAPHLELEASGGVTLETLPEIAKTNVDRISVGALTHSAVQLDVALDVVDVH